MKNSRAEPAPGVPGMPRVNALGDLSNSFASFGDKIWINCAHQGPLPLAAAREAREAIEWKTAPFALTTERFTGVPRRMKDALGRLIGARREEIILANSASYGMHLFANGIPWRDGDQVVLVRGDFPSVILPWLALERRGVEVRQITPRGNAVDADDLEKHLTPSTRIFCTTWVHSFSGHAVDLHALGQLCRSRDVTFIVNGAQAIGARPLNVRSTPIDGFTSVGFKWLCGPYGTGFVWMRPKLLESLEYNQAYWLAMQTADDLASEQSDPTLPTSLGARRYDLFGTANFFNFKPWAAAVEFLLELGVDRIAAHDQALVSRFIEGLHGAPYQLLSPAAGTERSTLVLVTHEDQSRNAQIYRRLREAGVYCAFRRGNLRFSPHVHNTGADIDRTLDVLLAG